MIERYEGKDVMVSTKGEGAVQSKETKKRTCTRKRSWMFDKVE